MTSQLQAAAARHCSGRLMMLHEGGYSDVYVPFCGLSVIEQLAGHRTSVIDPYLREVSNWGYQGLQPHQQEVISKSVEVVELLKSKLGV